MHYTSHMEISINASSALTTMKKFLYLFRVGAIALLIIPLFLSCSGCGCYDCPPAPMTANTQKPTGINLFIDNSGSMAALIYQNTRMRDQLFNNIITGIEPIAQAWEATTKCYLVSDKVDSIPFDTLQKIIGTKAHILKRFNGQGTPLDIHFANALGATGDNEIGIFVTDGIICATAQDIGQYKKETGKETFTRDNLSEFAAMVKKEVSEKFKNSEDFVFKVFRGTTEIEFTPDMPYYNYKNKTVSNIKRKVFPYYYFVWGPNKPVLEMVDRLNKTAGFLTDLEEIELHIVRIVGRTMEPVSYCLDPDLCGGATHEWDSTESFLEIHRGEQEKTGFFINAPFLELAEQHFERGEYTLGVEILDSTGQKIFEYNDLSWSDMVKTSGKGKISAIINTDEVCSVQQINRNNYFFNFIVDNTAISKMSAGSQYTIVFSVRCSKPDEVTEKILSIATDNDETGPIEGRTFGLRELLHALKDVPSYTDWKLMEYSCEFKYQ